MNIEQIKEIDKENMLDLLLSFPEQCIEAKNISKKISLPLRYKKISNIIVTGLGGSAIGGEVVKTYLNRKINIPVIVNRNYHLPYFVSSNTLCFVVSYSGNTEETLSAFKEANKKKCKIITVTSNGRLLELSEKNKIPAFKLPSKMPPRTTLGYQSLGMLYVLESLGKIKIINKEFDELFNTLKILRLHLHPKNRNNIARKIAAELYKNFTIIYGTEDFTAVSAYRLKCQINENSKSYAIYNVLPELNHNEIVGWEFPQELLKKTIAIFIRDKDDEPQIKKRIEITKSIIENKTKKIIELWTRGEHLLTKIFSTIYIGDFISFYLSIINKVDPTPVEAIDFLKKKLSEY